MGEILDMYKEEQALLDAQFQKTKAPKLEEKPEEKSTLHSNLTFSARGLCCL